MLLNTLYLGSLVVGGIAAISLTHLAFERPNTIINDYLNENFGFTKNEIVNKETVESYESSYKKFMMRKDLIGIRVIDFLEAIVVIIYLIAEIALFLLFLFSAPTDTNAIDPNYNLFMEIGYSLLCMGIIITGMTFVTIMLSLSKFPISKYDTEDSVKTEVLSKVIPRSP